METIQLNQNIFERTQVNVRSLITAEDFFDAIDALGPGMPIEQLKSFVYDAPDIVRGTNDFRYIVGLYCGRFFVNVNLKIIRKSIFPLCPPKRSFLMQLQWKHIEYWRWKVWKFLYMTHLILSGKPNNLNLC